MKNVLKNFLLLSMLLGGLFSCAKKTTTGPATRSAAYREKVVSTATMSADIINGVNAYRATKGLPALRLMALAASEAARHSTNMAAKRIPFGHSGFNERAVAIANEMSGTSSTGENIAFGKMTWRQVIDAWLKSPDHKANIEGAFNYTGVGVAKDKRGIVYYTQIFIKK
ncbi:MAG: CAP domain-containing protein [Chitinophagaceae bacterium]